MVSHQWARSSGQVIFEKFLQKSWTCFSITIYIELRVTDNKLYNRLSFSAGCQLLYAILWIHNLFTTTSYRLSNTDVILDIVANLLRHLNGNLYDNGYRLKIKLSYGTDRLPCASIDLNARKQWFDA